MVVKKAASASSTSSSTPARPPKSTERRMVLRARSSEKMKKVMAQLSEPESGKRSKATPKKKKSKVDALKPKKPPTAFFYFLEDFRKDFQDQNPDVKSMRDIGKACGDKWKTMKYEEKVHYYDIATEKRAKFDKAMAEYNKRKERGEFLEYEQDSEFDG